MTDEIIKLYSNAGFIQKRCKDYSCIVCDKNKDCDKYPPFTAEKQLELIKWLLEKWIDVRFVHNSDGIYYISSFNNVSYTGKNLEECIVSFVNNAWQDLTEEERKQIKEILE